MPRHPDTTLGAIKNAIDIVALVGDYLPSMRRVGSKFKALCPFHDDHNPSLELNPDRQSYKCWSCGAGGDVFDFVQNIERVDFAEALRMLADRAGIVLERQPAHGGESRGPSKADLHAVNAWAEGLFAGALAGSSEALAYVEGRGLSRGSIERFRLGYAPDSRGWLLGEARRAGYDPELLEKVGLAVRDEEGGSHRERFRGRLMFPIRDFQGRTVGFGGRILPRVEREMAGRGRGVAKYLNTPETSLFRKRTLLYGADRARASARQEGWVAVVEGYTDVIAAHQVGLENAVGTLGTALGEEHLVGLERLAPRVVLVFDGDEAGMSAADRSLELFLGSKLELRVLTLPEGEDPCDFLLARGGGAFRERVERAPDPLNYVIDRAEARFDLDSSEGTRRAAEWVLGIVNAVPTDHRLGIDVKIDKALDTLSFRLRVAKDKLIRMRNELRRPAVHRALPRSAEAPAPPVAGPEATAPIVLADLDRTDVELMQVALGEPEAIGWLSTRVSPSSLREAPLRALLQACYDLKAEGLEPTYGNLMLRLGAPALRALATDLAASTALSRPEPAPLSEELRPAPWTERLARLLDALDARARQARLEELRRALDAADPHAEPEARRAIELEYRRLLTGTRTRKT